MLFILCTPLHDVSYGQLLQMWYISAFLRMKEFWKFYQWLPHRLLAQAEELKAAALKAKEESPQQAIRQQMHQALKVLKI